jgi:hypothetical protein
MTSKPFTEADYDRMACELEKISELVRHHPEKNHHTAERLKTIATELRVDAKAAHLKSLRPV